MARTRIWDEDNGVWQEVGGQSAADGVEYHVVDPVAPVAPRDGTLWTNPDEDLTVPLHDHDSLYLPLTGGTLTGGLTIDTADLTVTGVVTSTGSDGRFVLDTNSRGQLIYSGGGAGVSTMSQLMTNKGTAGFRGNGLFLADDGAGTAANEQYWYIGRPYSASGRFRIGFESGAGSYALAAGGDMRGVTIGLDILVDGSVVMPNTTMVASSGFAALSQPTVAGATTLDSAPMVDLAAVLDDILSRLDAAGI